MSTSTFTGALLALALTLPLGSALAQFDPQHKAWTTLLAKHVILIDGGKASRLRYADLAKERGQSAASEAGAPARGGDPPSRLQLGSGR